MKVLTFKMPFPTRQFNLGQRVWIVYLTGDQAALCFGRFRGRGRWIRSWVKWRQRDRQPPDIQQFEISDEFGSRIFKEVKA